MPVIVLLRHGVSSANTAGILAGRAPGVSLTDQGVSALRDTLQMLPQRHFSRLLHSPLMRCEQTAQIAASAVTADSVAAVDDLIELDYGEWTGRSLKELGSEELWKTVVESASQARFPGGESIAEAADRAVSQVRTVVDELRAEERSDEEKRGHSTEDREGRAERWALLVSHGDIIKAIIADALAMPLDDFQRISVAPGSFTVIDFSGPRPVLTAMSVTAAGLSEGSAPGGGGLR
ncbi:histidine phosphatase family protein [Brevibacterium sp. UCMA 11752]|uniref:histidine phosphatase family protein n=1 Tax=Brevibacterium sp. UCMA 11752 TaxID=2745946 RepID=UPI001F251EF1|nr:histidine phosphatase family protein [Brevibacterium sp. UCMA 11752]MCF2588104.1 histidine phosphatase family protein [Brevibacterium sp. UCMA 11752]